MIVLQMMKKSMAYVKATVLAVFLQVSEMPSPIPGYFIGEATFE